MKKIFLLIFCSFILFHKNTFSQNVIVIDSIPDSLESFIELRDELAISPSGGAALFAIAMIIYTQNKELGRKAFVITLDRSQLVKGDDYKGFRPQRIFDYHLKNLRKKPWIAKSYMLDTSPLLNYETPYKIKYKIKKEKYNTEFNGQVGVYINCTGSIRPRELKMIKNNRGIWKVIVYRNLFKDVAPPTPNVDDGF